MEHSSTSQYILKAGSRGSPLALVQVEEIKALFKAHNIPGKLKSMVITTTGDQDKTTNLSSNTQDDFFTDTLDQALLDGTIDIAIHSAKDLPEHLNPELDIIALTASQDETDAYIGKVPFQELPHGAVIGTSSPLRINGIKDLNPHLISKPIRGTINERLAQLDAGAYDGIIVASIALHRLQLSQRITEIMPWETTPLQGQLAITARRDNASCRELCAPLDIRRTYGTVTLVGAGPGDPELITLKAIKALKTTDCVFYDYLANPDLLLHAPQAEHINVGKRKGQHSLPQIELSKLLRQKSMEGKNVVRLKGGDPLIFGRGAEERQYLRAFHIDVHVIPGICSATGIPSNLGLPLTARHLSASVAFVSGHDQDEGQDVKDSVKVPNTDTIVYFMGLTKLHAIVTSLQAHGHATTTPIIIIAKGTCLDERRVCGTLATIENLADAAQLSAPALVIVGPTVALYHDDNPLMNTILYTGSNPQKYQSLGHIIHWPMIHITEAPLDTAQTKARLQQLDQYHMIMLTSRFAVKYFFAILRRFQIPLEELRLKDFIVIGQETANALKEYHFLPALVASIETSHGLLAELTATFDVTDKKILFPRSALSNPTLKRALDQRGAQVDEFIVYQNTKPPKRSLPHEPIDTILFTSPSTVRNFLKDYAHISKKWNILSKGAVTQKYLQDKGYTSEII